MIMKNEEDTLRNCLHSVKDIADEMIIVDTGSTDRSKEIAREFTDKMYDFEWINDFAAARNYSFKQATKDYILWLDADDVLLEDDQKKLLALKKDLDSAVDSVTMIYDYSFDEFGNVTLSLRRNRLVKRSQKFKWHGYVHEYLAVRGEIIDPDIHVTHKRIHHSSGRNLQIYESKLDQGEKFTPRDYYYYANELFDNQHHSKAIKMYHTFLSMEEGWMEDKIAACGKLADCYSKVGEFEKQKNAIFKSFDYDVPRPEHCCRLGYIFLSKQQYHLAIFWYEQAVKFQKPEGNWGFFHEAYATWLPHINLCICYYYLGDFQKAYDHNEVARKFRPEDKDVLHNKQLLKSKL